MFYKRSHHGDVLIGMEDGQVMAIYLDCQETEISILSSITYPPHKRIEGWRLSDLVPPKRFLILKTSLNGSIARFMKRTYVGSTVILPKDAKALGRKTRIVPPPPIHIPRDLPPLPYLDTGIPSDFDSPFGNPFTQGTQEVKGRYTAISFACIVIISVIFAIVYIVI